MRRRSIVLLTAAAGLGGAGLAAALGLWLPLASPVLASVPPLAAPLRTGAEHDALYGPADDPSAYVIDVAAPNRTAGRAGHALVLGLRHTNAEAAPQIAELRTRFAGFEPTLVLVEGRLGLHFGSSSGLLARFGESGEAVALAAAAGVPYQSLEPDPASEVADAVTAFSPAEVLAFYFLRVFTSERGNSWPITELESEAAHLLGKRGSRTGLADALPDLAAMDAFWREHRPQAAPADWRELSAKALWRDPKGTWPARLAEHINRYRDRHFVAAIAAAVARGDRVLAVCGSSHAILFEPALRAAIGGG